jgi:hypothetical protein
MQNVKLLNYFTLTMGLAPIWEQTDGTKNLILLTGVIVTLVANLLGKLSITIVSKVYIYKGK